MEKKCSSRENVWLSFKELAATPHRFANSFFLPDPRSPSVPTDLIGPLVVLVSLLLLLHYGSSQHPNPSPVSPSAAVFIFGAVVPIVTFGLLKASGTVLTFVQVVSLLGYSLTSHVLTLALTLAFRSEDDHVVFYIFFTLLGGLSCIRIVIIFAVVTQRPPLTLLASCFACISHLLFLLFAHFAYVAPRQT